MKFGPPLMGFSTIGEPTRNNGNWSLADIVLGVVVKRELARNFQVAAISIEGNLSSYQ
jgi:hypothetical protein